MGSKSILTITLLIVTIVASSLLSAQAYVVDSIAKPSVPEFSVLLVSHPYDVPPKTTTTVDQYTGKETTNTIPGYRVENKSIEITIKNQPFTPYNLTAHTGYNHETQETYTYDRNVTVNFYYNINVKGHYGSEWKAVGSSLSSVYEGPQSNVQLDSENSVISIKAEDYPNDAVLDFRVQAAIGYYTAWGRSVIIMGYDFYGQQSDWSSIQQLTLGTPQTPTLAPTVPPTFPPTEPPTLPPAATQTPIATPIQPNPQAESNFTLSWEQGALVVCIAVIAVLIFVLVVSRRKKGMKNILTITLITILSASTLIIIQPANATFTPAIPQFTIKITNHTYDEPTTTQINQYTGETTTLGGKHYEWKTIDISITNQANQPDNQNSLRYNIRHKGQYTDQWTQESGEGSFYPQNSSSSTTEFSYYLQGSTPDYPGAVSAFAGLPEGTKISFQVQALWGYDDYDFTYGMRSYSFQVTSSSRSDIKTVTLYSGEVTTEEGTASTTTPVPIVTLSPTQNPTMAPTQNPTAVPTANTQSPAQPEVTSTAGLAWKDIVIVAAFAVIAALAAALVLTRRKKQ